MRDRPLPGRGAFLEIVSSLAALVSDGRFRNKKVISEREEPNDGSIGRRESLAPAPTRPARLFFVNQFVVAGEAT